jgi:acetyl-CoA carboxylase carboxyl transferase subunit beta
MLVYADPAGAGGISPGRITTMRSFFHRSGKFQPLQTDDERAEQAVPDGLWIKCPKCGELIYTRELENNLWLCPKCDFHHRLTARQRLSVLADADSFEEWDTGIRTTNPLNFAEPSGTYETRIAKTVARSGENESLVTGRMTIGGHSVAVAVCDFGFLGASMGSVFGEKLARMAERALEERLPVLTINASGGARMHEGLFSLMQMAKTIATLRLLGAAKLPHISLLTDPCYGGVSASYAMVADVILAEPGALVGFAGPRVIEQITKQKLPEGFQTAEFLLQHGMIDGIVSRPDLPTGIGRFLAHYRRLRPSEPVLIPTAEVEEELPVPTAVAGANGGIRP